MSGQANIHIAAAEQLQQPAPRTSEFIRETESMQQNYHQDASAMDCRNAPDYNNTTESHDFADGAVQIPPEFPPRMSQALR